MVRNIPSRMPERGLSAFPPSSSLRHTSALLSTAFRHRAVPLEFPVDPSVVIQSAWAILIGLTLNADTVSFALRQHFVNEKLHLHDTDTVDPQLRRVEVLLDNKITLAELFDIFEAQQAAGHDACDQSSPSCILQLAPCRPGQLPSEACKAAADAASRQGSENHTFLVIVCAWNAPELSVFGSYDDQTLKPARQAKSWINLYILSVLSTSDGEAIWVSYRSVAQETYPGFDNGIKTAPKAL